MGFISMTDRCDKCGHSPRDNDAMRSRLAELARERDEAVRYICEWQSGTHDFACESELDDATKHTTPCGCAERRVALAAWQAECARLREELADVQETLEDSDMLPFTAASIGSALASAPGSTDALREVCMRVADHVAFFANTHPISKADAHTIVSRILGERSDDAPQGRGERGKEDGDA